jgi:hypothetical protein
VLSHVIKDGDIRHDCDSIFLRLVLLIAYRFEYGFGFDIHSKANPYTYKEEMIWLTN